MSPEQHARIKEIFLAACAMPPDRRAAHLREACGQDPDLFKAVELLLYHADSVTGRGQTAAAMEVTKSADSDPGRTARLDEPRAARAGSAASRNFQPGTLIAGRYRVVAMLGRGGMGEVYRAEDIRLRQTVALKFLPPDVAGSPAWLARLHHEVRIARTITHPNVCRVHDIGEADGDTFICMEYIDGEDLKSLLRRIGRLPSDKAMEISRQICLGLAAAHAGGVLHRDLKPANIMLDGRGQVRITDFGLAVLKEEMPAGEHRAGTPAYMAPEQMSGKPATVRSDIYSLGLVMYEVFTGRYPYEGARTFGEIAEVKDSSHPPSPSTLVEDIDPMIERVILNCLEKDQELRPASTTAVIAALYGGDLLSAILAAGETPSPDMVAAAGQKTKTGASVVLRSIAAFIVLLMTTVFLSPRVHPLIRAHESKAPLVLAEKARELVRETLHAPPAVDEAFGFRGNLHPGAALDAVLGRVSGPDRYATRETHEPLFWYRWSDSWLRPVDPMNVVFGSGRVEPTDPLLLRPGNMVIVLGSDGRLLGLERQPSESDAKFPADSEKVWASLLARTGFPSQSVKPSTPQRTVYLPADARLIRRAWLVTGQRETGGSILIEGAELAGQPVFMAVLDASAGDTDAGTWQTVGSRRERMQLSQHVLWTALFIISVPLAVSNLRRGRSDPRGALVLAGMVFVVRNLGWLLAAHHVPGLGQFRQAVILSASGALAESTLVWLFYTALEPFVRRFWPHTLISWSRLVKVRLRDPVVGRDVLVGSVVGAAWSVAVMADRMLPDWLGWSARGTFWSEEVFAVMGGLRPALASIIGALWSAIYSGTYLLLLLVLLRACLKRSWAAQLIAALILAGLLVPTGNHIVISMLLIGGLAASGVLIMTRFGLLTIAVSIFMASVLIRLPLSLDLRVWYSDLSLVGLGISVGLAGWGMWTARAHSPSQRPWLG